jgi:hypothetical protein
MKHIEKIEKSFRNKFVRGNVVEEDIDVPFSWDVIRDFLRSSHTSFVTDLIKRVEGERGKPEAVDNIIRLLNTEL